MPLVLVVTHMQALSMQPGNPELGVPSRLLPSVSSLQLRPQCPTGTFPAVMLQLMRLSLETENNRELV